MSRVVGWWWDSRLGEQQMYLVCNQGSAGLRRRQLTLRIATAMFSIGVLTIVVGLLADAAHQEKREY